MSQGNSGGGRTIRAIPAIERLCKHSLLRCEGCRRCSVCNEYSNWCDCPFPTKGAMYSRLQMEIDLEGIEKLSQGANSLFRLKLIDGFELVQVGKRCEAMKRKCKAKLFFTAQSIADRRQSKQATVRRVEVLSGPVDKYGRILSTSEVQKLKEGNNNGGQK